jgi:hypothetical protein
MTVAMLWITRSYAESKTREHAAMVGVLSTRLKLRTGCVTNKLHGVIPMNPPIFVPQMYVGELRKVDVSGCPEDFRLAWVDYVHTWERNANADIIDAGKDVAALITAMKTWNFERSLKRADQRDIEEALKTLERIAAAHGIAMTTVR